MSKNYKKTIAFIFFLLAGITIGAFISQICDGKKYLDWLSWGQQIGLSTEKPAVLDLVFLKIAFGFTLKVTIAQIFTVILSILLFNKTCKSL
jgi:hypothetical protein